ncbi:hypothetical protein [Kaistia terrae]|uniref:Transcriptional coactivator p15 (PC4) C-terminal domain-containing protein n=1 Tax=Kaistia terrae TaxID=537017 RepID=A0ABW0PXT0_9HYPH|nr:hypothetical protein [Kaistia terrae]MCX5579447.1 hypothetical protein [Kaistia terrae]
MTDRAIATIPKNAREAIRVSLRDTKGRRAIDVRIFEDRGKGPEQSPKGLSIRPDLIRAVIEGLQQAESAAAEEGLIGPPA